MDASVKKKLLLVAALFVGVIILLSAIYLATRPQQTEYGDEVLVQPRTDIVSEVRRVYNLDAYKRRVNLTPEEQNRLNVGLRYFLETMKPESMYLSINLSTVDDSGQLTLFTITTEENETYSVEEEYGYTTVKDPATGAVLFISPRDGR